MIVVELASRNDLARHGSLRLVISQHRAFDFAAFDGRLNDDFRVVLGRQVQRLGQFSPVVDLRDTYRRTKIGGFDEHRAPEAFFQPSGVLVSFPAGNGKVIHRGQAPLAKQPLHDILIHGHGRTQHTGADVWQVGQLQETLHGPVLTERSVQNRENDV